VSRIKITRSSQQHRESDLDWNAWGSADILPSVKDLYLPALTAGLYWGFKKLGGPAITKLVFLLRGLRYRELVKAKNIRIDRLKTLRELKKEAALYTCFLLSAVISLGLLILPIYPAQRPFSAQIAQFVFYLTPVLILEIMWLVQKSFVDILIEEASKLPQEITRSIKKGTQSPLRDAMRKKRIEKKKSKSAPTFKRVRRRTF